MPVSASKHSEAKRAAHLAAKDEAHGRARQSRLGARTKEPSGEYEPVVHAEVIPVGRKRASDLEIFKVDISRYKTLFQAAPIEQVEIIKRGVGAIEVVN